MQVWNKRSVVTQTDAAGKEKMSSIQKCKKKKKTKKKKNKKNKKREFIVVVFIMFIKPEEGAK